LVVIGILPPSVDALADFGLFAWLHALNIVSGIASAAAK
jgi:hypothetical protein